MEFDLSPQAFHEAVVRGSEGGETELGHCEREGEGEKPLGEKDVSNWRGVSGGGELPLVDTNEEGSERGAHHQQRAHRHV